MIQKIETRKALKRLIAYRGTNRYELLTLKCKNLIDQGGPEVNTDCDRLVTNFPPMLRPLNRLSLCTHRCQLQQL